MPEHKDLSNVFARQPRVAQVETDVDRGAGLAGILPQRPKTRQRPARPAKAAPVSPPEAPEAQQQPGVAENAPAVSSASQKAVTGPENRGVYIPPEMKKTLRRIGLDEEKSYTDLLIDAFEAVSDDSIREVLNPGGGAGSRMPSRRRGRAGDKAGTQIQLRLDSEQDQWLLAKQHELDAPSRSALVTVVYQLFLDQRTS